MGRTTIPLPRRKTQFPTGPKFLRPGKAPEQGAGPGEPPPWFLNGNNSREEWPPYWALTKLLGAPGYGTWEYQGNIEGGRKKIGGSVPDFIIHDRRPAIVVRVQTDYWHIMAPRDKQQKDIDSRRSMERAGYRVVDIFPQHYMIDGMGYLTGQACIAVMWDALKYQERPSPLATRTSTARA